MATPAETASLVNDLRLYFPWIDDVGISPAWLQETAATAASSSEIVQKIRQLPQYKARFPGLTRGDGTLRMNEAQYISQENSYRTLLKQYGFDTNNEFKSPSSLLGFFDGEIAPDELRDRLAVYKQVQEGGQRIKDAFYVYAGLDLTDDDLYEAIVDPAAEQNLRNKYNQAVAGQSFDYTTWITRATQVGLRNVATELEKLKKRGALTADAVSKIQSVSPDFARQIMDAIYTGGERGGQAGSLNLQELLDSFQFAAVGAAAQNAGLSLPTKERLAAIRAAGIDQAKMIQGYQQFGQNKEVFNAAIQRARGTERFGVLGFEKAMFLGDADAMRQWEAGLTYMESAGKTQGQFRFDENRQGRFQQKGLSYAA
jgi:hypothetical protein